MTRFEKIKNMSLDEMTDVVLTLVTLNVCLNDDSERMDCEGCIFHDLCRIKPFDDIREWLEEEVDNGT